MTTRGGRVEKRLIDTRRAFTPSLLTHKAIALAAYILTIVVSFGTSSLGDLIMAVDMLAESL